MTGKRTLGELLEWCVEKNFEFVLTFLPEKVHAYTRVDQATNDALGHRSSDAFSTKRDPLEALAKSLLKIHPQKIMTCRTCEGRGKAFFYRTKDCPVCKGFGYVLGETNDFVDADDWITQGMKPPFIEGGDNATA